MQEFGAEPSRCNESCKARFKQFLLITAALLVFALTIITGYYAVVLHTLTLQMLFLGSAFLSSILILLLIIMSINWCIEKHKRRNVLKLKRLVDEASINNL